MQGIKRCNTKNPLILIDEVDKMVKDFKGDPASTLLDILDANQNKMFVDNYLEEPFDLSNVLFILTANSEENIPAELKDRLEIIYLNSYTALEKVLIARDYLLPRIYEDHLINKEEIIINDDVLLEIINSYTKEPGVRELERQLSTIVRKIITNLIKTKNKLKINISKDVLTNYLGNSKYPSESILINKPGIIKGLACTNYGGVVMTLECILYKGNGEIKYTGQLGEVMKESIEVAMSYIKANSTFFKLDLDYLKTIDLHLHALEGSIKKEGPSSGVAITSAILSLLLNKPLSDKVSMTGEISLTGNILGVGGIKEKAIAAYNEGIKILYIPYSNKNDLEDIPKEVKEQIKFILVNDYQEIYQKIFNKKAI
jgi:ATP-dependent Lon protease